MANLPNISYSDAAQELAVICSPGYLTHHAHSRSFSSQQIAHVARLLEIVDHGVWSTVPRLYIVLRSAGLLKLRGLFLSVQHTDAHFPYSVFTLPTGVKLDERSAFLQAQACILTEATPYGKWDFGEHAHFANSDHVPLARKDVLGTGGSGQVESVVLRSSTSKVQSASDQLFVRKLIHRKRFGRLQQGLEEFKNELKILKRIQHRHLVEIIGSYTDPTFAALIMSPIADCDLSEFLKKIAPNNSRRRSTMRTFFGCLATALSYLHGKRIRHRDLKPSNILVHGPNVLITDFGSPRDCNETRSTTEGRPIGTTAKYNAPEVADHAERSFSADIWSLGCVFLEMFSVLKGFGVEQIAVFMRRDGSGESSYYAETAHYHANSRSVWRWLSMLRESSTHEPNNEPANWIQAMLSEDRYVRPKADVLALEIATCQSASGHSGEFCGICCRPEDEEFVDMEMDDASIVIPESPIFEPKLQDAKIIASTEEISMPSAAAAEFRMEYGAQRNLMPITPGSESTLTTPQTTISFTQPRFFVLRSIDPLDIETSFAWGSWTSGLRTNQRLNKAYKGTSAPIYFFFSVVASRRFCGVAEMKSDVNFDTTLEHWQEDGWEGNFNIEWISTDEVYYDDVEHLRMKERNEGNNITRVMSGTEICFSSGAEMMRRFGVEHFLHS